MTVYIEDLGATSYLGWLTFSFVHSLDKSVVDSKLTEGFYKLRNVYRAESYPG